MDRMLDLGSDARRKWDELHAERHGCSSNGCLDSAGSAQCRSTDDRDLFDARCNLLEQLQPSCPHLRFDIGQSGDVAAGMFHALYEALTNWVDDIHKYRWNR